VAEVSDRRCPEGALRALEVEVVRLERVEDEVDVLQMFGHDKL
jgi:hypothetical protein